MRMLTDHFNPPKAGIRYFPVIDGWHWISMGLPRVSVQDRVLYCALFAFTDSRGMRICEINRSVWLPGKKNVKSIKSSLSRLEKADLAYSRDEEWFAIIPQIDWDNYPHSRAPKPPTEVTKVTDSVTNVTSDQIDGAKVTNVTDKVTNVTGKVTKVTDSVTNVTSNKANSGEVTKVTDSVTNVTSPRLQTSPKRLQTSPLQERKEEERNYYNRHNEISEQSDERTKSDRVVVVGVDYSNFDPLSIFQSGPHWLSEDLQPPEDLGDRVEWIKFAANCQTWRRVQKAGAEPLNSETAYARDCRRRIENDLQQGVAEILAALELAQNQQRQREAETKAQKARSQQAPPKIREYRKDDPGPDDFGEWMQAICPDFAARLQGFRECCKGKHSDLLAPHELRLDNTIKQVEQRLARIAVPRAVWGSKAQGVGQLHAILRRAREELEAAQ